jgi:serine/threonine protein kinase
MAAHRVYSYLPAGAPQLPPIPEESVYVQVAPSEALSIVKVNPCIPPEFKEIRKLGAGSFAGVFEVMDLENGIVMACKCSDKDAEHEIYMMKRCQTYCVKYIGTFSGPPKHLILMENCAGGDLHSLVNSIPGFLPEARLKKIAKDVLRCLDEIHKAGIVHRDIKSQNIFLMEDGTSKVGDFGLAVDTGGPIRISGTVGYIPWEVIALSTKNNYLVTEVVPPYRSWTTTYTYDMWGFGITMFELWCKKRPNVIPLPFDALDTMRGVRCPEWLYVILTSSLELDPSKRATAEYLLSYLESTG